MVEQGGDLCGIQAGGVFDKFKRAGVDVAAAGVHHQAFQRGEAHAGVLRCAAEHGGHGGAGAQVGNHQRGVGDVFAQHGGGFAGNVAVGGAVKAVAAQAVFAVERARHGVGVGMFG